MAMVTLGEAARLPGLGKTTLARADRVGSWRQRPGSSVRQAAHADAMYRTAFLRPNLPRL